jgi:hypothetical protein
MSQRIVIDGENGWLNLRAARINWWEEPGRGDPEGAAPMQLRWMIHPEIGLPLQHFQVWWMPLPPTTFVKQDLANAGDWQLLETVGLPVGGDWQDTNYSQEPQGFVSSPVDAIEAARSRLYRGAPRKGWPYVEVDGRTLPDWQRPNDDAFLDRVRDGDIMKGLHQMLLSEPSPSKHRFFFVDMDRSDTSLLLPRLLLNNAIGSINGNEQPRGKWHPLSLMAMSAGSDPLAALALGFGTAVEPQRQGEELYMVTVRHESYLGVDLELADIARPVALYACFQPCWARHQAAQGHLSAKARRPEAGDGRRVVAAPGQAATGTARAGNPVRRQLCDRTFRLAANRRAADETPGRGRRLVVIRAQHLPQ